MRAVARFWMPIPSTAQVTKLPRARERKQGAFQQLVRSCSLYAYLLATAPPVPRESCG